MLLMPAELSGPKPTCYVCNQVGKKCARLANFFGHSLSLSLLLFKMSVMCFSQTPLFLEVNTSKMRLRDIVEKILKGKLSVNSPIIMQGSCLLYEVGEDLEENMVTQYNLNLDKVSVPAPRKGLMRAILSITPLLPAVKPYEDVYCFYRFLTLFPHQS